MLREDAKDVHTTAYVLEADQPILLRTFKKCCEGLVGAMFDVDWGRRCGKRGGSRAGREDM